MALERKCDRLQKRHRLLAMLFMPFVYAMMALTSSAAHAYTVLTARVSSVSPTDSFVTYVSPGGNIDVTIGLNATTTLSIGNSDPAFMKSFLATKMSGRGWVVPSSSNWVTRFTPSDTVVSWNEALSATALNVGAGTYKTYGQIGLQSNGQSGFLAITSTGPDVVKSDAFTGASKVGWQVVAEG